MILVDTSVWIAHLRDPEPRLGGLLERGQALVHPFVIGELACGNLRNRGTLLGYLDRLSAAPLAESAEVRGVVERYRLMGQGLGWVDVHLLTSCLLAHSGIWTQDAGLERAARQLRIPGLSHTIDPRIV